MKVKIVKCSGDSYWYKNRIGEEFEVELDSEDRYKTKEIQIMGAVASFIQVSDCEIIEDEVKQSTTPAHYKEELSIYKISEIYELNSYEFDIIKRVMRCRKKGQFVQDIDKTIHLLELYKKEYEKKQ